MAITRVKATGKVSHYQSSSGSFATLPSAGNNIVLEISGAVLNLDYSGFSVTDNQSGTYTLAVQSPATTSGNRSRSAIFYRENISTPSGTFTITVSDASQNAQCSWSAEEFSGLTTTTSLDKTANSNGASGTPDTTATATTTVADELLCSAMGVRATQTSITVSAGTQEYETLDFSVDEPGEGDTRIVSATGAYNTTWTLGQPTGVWSAVIATFKGAAVAGDTQEWRGCYPPQKPNTTPNLMY